MWVLRDLTNLEKNLYLRHFDAKSRYSGNLYTGWEKQWTVLKPIFAARTVFFESRTEYIFVAKFYHDRASSGFFKYLRYIVKTQGNNALSELGPECGRTLYIYKSDSTRTPTISDSDLDWCFPDKYSFDKGLAVRGFTFTFPNLKNSLKYLVEPSIDLINENTQTESVSSVPTQYSFVPEQKTIEESIKHYNNVTISYYINECNFLYDKSNLINETFTAALNKKNINLRFNQVLC